jgi:hypothetical protein
VTVIGAIRAWQASLICTIAKWAALHCATARCSA